MIGIIIVVVLTLITTLALGVNFELNSYGEPTNIKFKPRLRMFFGLLPLLSILFGCFTIVRPNNVGIAYNPFKGGVQSETLTEGYKSKSPLTDVYQLTTTVKEMKFTNLSVQTKDSQYVTAELQIQARIDKTQAFEYFKKYKDSELEDIASIINNTIKNELEKVTTQYNVIDILGEARSDIVTKTLDLVKTELLKDGILVERLVIVDVDAGEAIEKAIEQEAVAKKNVDTASYKKQQAELEGEAKVAEAKATAEANALLEKSLTDKILVEKWIEAWAKGGSQVPKVSGDDFMLNISELLK